jgi:hypothetical protein
VTPKNDVGLQTANRCCCDLRKLLRSSILDKVNDHQDFDPPEREMGELTKKAQTEQTVYT